MLVSILENRAQKADWLHIWGVLDFAVYGPLYCGICKGKPRRVRVGIGTVFNGTVAERPFHHSRDIYYVEGFKKAYD